MRFFAGFATLALALSASAAPFKRDVATVDSDIASISSQVSTLDASITRFGTTKSLLDALAIASDAETLNGLITQATDDTNASDAFTEDEGSTILSAIQALAPQIVTTLSNLDSQHGNVASLPIPGVAAAIESELETLNSDTTALETALSSKSPADDQTPDQSVFDTVNAAFVNAISTFSS